MFNLSFVDPKEPSASPSTGEDSGGSTFQPTAAPVPRVSPGNNEPSSIPSMNPTMTNDCLDDGNYKSPFNPTKGCELHSAPNFDCYTFQSIMSSEELQELLDSCPKTCNIQCDTKASLSPSSQPSACTDDDDYKSPFSNDFGCAFFASASLRCDEWGEALTEEQTLHLWRSCPVACGLECG